MRNTIIGLVAGFCLSSLPSDSEAQSAGVSVAISARVVAPTADVFSDGGVELLRSDGGSEPGWAVVAGEAIPSGYSVRIVVRDGDHARGTDLPTWQPLFTGEVIRNDRVDALGTPGQWFEVTVEHNDS
jgi:hypothetical protein